MKEARENDEVSEAKHPIAGGIFLAVAVGLIGFGAYSGLQAGGHGPVAGTGSPSEDLNAKILEAIQLGQSGDVEGAAAGLKDIVARHPDNVDAVYNLGVALIGTGETETAEKQFRRVLELAPGDADALAELAGLKKDGGDLAAAFALLEQVPVQDPKIRQRLLEDPLWSDIQDDERMKALYTKHGIAIREPDAVPPSGEPIR